MSMLRSTFQIFTTQLSVRPHGHRRSYGPGRIWRIDLRVYFACRRRALISRLWASRRRSNEKKKNSGGLSAVAGVLVVLPISTAKT